MIIMEAPPSNPGSRNILAVSLHGTSWMWTKHAELKYAWVRIDLCEWPSLQCSPCLLEAEGNFFLAFGVIDWGSSNGQPTHSRVTVGVETLHLEGLSFHWLLTMVPILQMEKLRLLEIKWLAQGYGGSKGFIFLFFKNVFFIFHDYTT